jgi:TetR/AcrR family tetracycline transcriptional repressor
MRLNRGDVLAGALDQLDRNGLDNLTMQALGASLGVRAGALYWHYASKGALIDAMAEAVISGIDYADDRSLTWEARLLAYARAVHVALLARRDGARLVAGTFVARRSTVQAGHVLVEVVQGSGLDVRDAATAALSVFYYILGYTIEEQAQRQLVEDGGWDAHQDHLRALLPDDIQEALHLSETSDTFDTGVETFIAGIRSRRSARPR